MSEQDLDRNEAATPFKLQKARERGAVAKSADFNAAAMIMAATLGCIAWLPGALKDMAGAMYSLFATAGTDLSQESAAAALLALSLGMVAKLLAPLLVGVVIVAILAGLLQSGPVFSVEPLSPDLTRLSLDEGFKRVFSPRLVYDGIKSTVKLLLLGGVIAVVLSSLLPGLAALSYAQSQSYLFQLVELSGGLLVKLLGVLLVLAGIDLIYVRREFAKRMRMSRREIKEEYKQREGDPRIRQRIRELRVKLLKRSQAMRGLPKADVLITNPTRIAVAIRYEHGVSAAPTVIAKGAGGLAGRMRDVAFRHGIPIVQDIGLARALYRQVDDGGFVPEEWYPRLAKVLVWALAARRSAGLGARGNAS